MKTRIIVDSTADLTPDIKERVHIVPLTVRFDSATFCVIAEDGSETEYHVSICKN